mmetsp:Transcript_20185/g.47744  ORF Transcript_20185/g.47744 Transcript_20185/m.47744 type:complete len:250 (+) Transcript_20185:507-1256(+)
MRRVACLAQSRKEDELPFRDQQEQVIHHLSGGGHFRETEQMDVLAVVGLLELIRRALHRQRRVLALNEEIRATTGEFRQKMLDLPCLAVLHTAFVFVLRVAGGGEAWPLWTLLARSAPLLAARRRRMLRRRRRRRLLTAFALAQAARRRVCGLLLGLRLVGVRLIRHSGFGGVIVCLTRGFGPRRPSGGAPGRSGIGVGLRSGLECLSIWPWLPCRHLSLGHEAVPVTVDLGGGGSVDVDVCLAHAEDQ